MLSKNFQKFTRKVSVVESVLVNLRRKSSAFVFVLRPTSSYSRNCLFMRFCLYLTNTRMPGKNFEESLVENNNTKYLRILFNLPQTELILYNHPQFLRWFRARDFDRSEIPVSTKLQTSYM